MEWFINGIKRYVDFNGRARRTEFWMYALFYMIGYIVLVVIDVVVGIGFLAILYSLGLLLPSLGVAVRRLHDTDRSGLWLLICLIPIIGALVLLYFYILEGTSGSNQYGADPKAQ